ncbi:MAG: murein biosynthesis integral membrane protein MurJ [Acidobacteria bacterium]|nr:murein biosynthesis integral membrane protein MurJ [Acidobacteriota bacterium]
MNRKTRPSSQDLARSAGVIGVATMTSRVLGLIRDQVLAYFFGAGDAMDAFRIAFRLPNVLRDLFAEGAMSASLVPTFTRAQAQGGKDRAFRLGSNVINLLLIISGLIVIAGMVCAGPLVEMYAAGFAGVPGKLELTIRLTRIMFPFLSMVTVAAILMAMLNALHQFFIPALAPAMFNVATILCAVIVVPIAPRLGIDPIVGVAVGTLAGGLGQIALQWPAARRQGFRYQPVLDLGDPWLKEIGRLMVPGIAGLAAVQVNLFVNSWLATDLGTGAVSWLDYAFRLMYLPIGLFGISIATAALPGISGHAASNDDPGVRRGFSSGLRMMLMLNIPATLGLVVLATPIVALIFERGRFTPADTAATAAALACYAPGLVGYSVVKLASPVFYAMGNSRIPVFASAVSVGCNITLNLMLVRVLGHRGLALGTAIAALLNAGLLLWMLRARLGGIEGRRLVTAVTKISLASTAMAFVAYSVERLLHGPLQGTAVPIQTLRVFGAIAAGMAVLGLSAHILRIEEFQMLRRRLASGRSW